MGVLEGAKNFVYCENDGRERDSKSNFVDDGRSPSNSNPNSSRSTTTGSQREPALEEKIGRRFFMETVKAEQREGFLRSLVAEEVGTNRVESNQIRSRGEFSRDKGRRVKEIVTEMEYKVNDARKEKEGKVRKVLLLQLAESVTQTSTLGELLCYKSCR